MNMLEKLHCTPEYIILFGSNFSFSHDYTIFLLTIFTSQGYRGVDFSLNIDIGLRL